MRIDRYDIVGWTGGAIWGAMCGANGRPVWLGALGAFSIALLVRCFAWTFGGRRP